MVRAGALITVLLCAGVASVAATETPTASAPSGWGEASAEILADDAYQTEFPEDDAEILTRPLTGTLGPVAVVVLYGLGGLALGLLLVWLVHAWIEWRRGARQAPDGLEDAAAGTGGDTDLPSLDAAQRLAETGRFAEAIHELLLTAIGYLSRRAAVGRDRSLTSRELVDRLELADERRRAFRELVLAVEVSHFGSLRPGAEDWNVCVDRFRTLTGRGTG